MKTKLLGEGDVQNVVSSDERVAVFVLKLTVDVFRFYRDKEKKNVALVSVFWRDSLKTRCFYEKRRQSVFVLGKVKIFSNNRARSRSTYLCVFHCNVHVSV